LFPISSDSFLIFAILSTKLLLFLPFLSFVFQITSRYFTLFQRVFQRVFGLWQSRCSVFFWSSEFRWNFSYNPCDMHRPSMSTMRLSWTEQSFASCCPRGSGGLLHSHQRWKQHSERDLFSLGRLIKFQQKTSKNQRGFEDNFSECDNVASDSFAVLENTARKCFLFSWFCIIRSWLMKLHKRRRRQHWFQFAMAASSWFFVEITANFLPQWKASRPTQQGLRCPCSKGWPCMVCGRSCWTRSALEQGKSCCCMRAHKAVPSHLNLCVNICIIMYYILRPCIHFTYWQICKCIHL
jgi:hypothetical protein